jgi:hypothetical protein
VPLGLRDPFVFGVFPGTLRGDGKDGELRAVALGLALFGIDSDETNDCYGIEVHVFLLFFCPIFLRHPKRGLLLPRRAAAFREGPVDVGEEPGKQKTRSCRAQEFARSRAQEREWQKKVVYRTEQESCEVEERANRVKAEKMGSRVRFGIAALTGGDSNREAEVRPGLMVGPTFE